MILPVQITNQPNRIRSTSLSEGSVTQAQKADQTMQETVANGLLSPTALTLSVINKKPQTFNHQTEDNHNALQQAKNKQQQAVVDSLKKNIDVASTLNSSTVLAAAQSKMPNKMYSPSSSQFMLQQHALDCYGIDADIKMMANKMKHSGPIAFVKKDQNSKLQLNSGAYISDMNNGDHFGQFRFYSGVGLTKYQTDQCQRLEFDEGSLAKLKDTYHNVSGVTNFLRDLLTANLSLPENSRTKRMYEKALNSFAYFKPLNQFSNGFLIYPNMPYVTKEPEAYAKDSFFLKDKKDGIILGAWAIHPNQATPFIDYLIKRTAVSSAKESEADVRTLYEIEKGTGVKYLSSILDLDVADIKMLKKLQADVLQHLDEQYNVNPAVDKIKMFFHFPVAEKTATLHLHVWVNKADHPLNNARSFELKDVIENLEAGKRVSDMLLARNKGVYHIPLKDTIGSIKGIPNRGTEDNPYLLKLV